MEHSSPSALPHLSYRLFLCTYFDNVYIMLNIINWHPCYKQGLCRFFQYFLVTRGLLLIKRRPICPLNRLSCHNKAWELHTQGAKEIIVTKAQLKHRHPLSTAHKVTWGLFVQSNKEFERTLVIGYQAMAWKLGVFT